ncbi:MAG TPA: pH regulation protein F, partial [Ignisphaera sp.]|nr:pH regulation protein F [Ignisphaera sp.]
MTSIEEHVLMVLSFIMPIYITAFLLYIVRALKGPTIPDIVLAIDALSY